MGKELILSIRKQNSIYLISELFVILFFILTAFVRLISNSSIALNICTISLLIAGYLNLVIAYARKDHYILLFAGFAAVCWLIGYLCRTNWHYDIKFFVDSLAYLGIAYSFIREKKQVRVYLILYYLIAIYILVELVVLKVPIRGFLKDHTSYNYISIILLFYLLILNYVQWQNEEEIQYIPAVLFLAVAIVSYGRGGIVTAAFYSVFLLIIKLKIHKGQRRKYIIAVIIVSAFSIFGKTIYDQILSTGSLNKFASMGMDSNGRSAIWWGFIKDCTSSVTNFIIGGNPDKLMIDGGNIHNSFLQLYASLGIFFFIFAMVLFISSIIRVCKNKDWWILLLVLTFAVRAFTDKLMYRGYFEIVFYIILFYKFVVNEKRQRIGII
ncbi:MAG: hypothetical protein IJ106_12015 [Parasporobacterium sp.]|nr:hypothetical protein [Parasporobacterium sp.]